MARTSYYLSSTSWQEQANSNLFSP
jgi:hypothetical protein